MRAAVVFVAVAVAAMASAAVVQEREKRSPGGGSVRLRTQEARIARLAGQIEHLEEVADETLSHNSYDALMGMASRLDDHYGSTCGGQFHCSGLSTQCVANLEVCDGIKDCENGHDEDEDTCNFIPAVGSSWRGGRVTDSCTNRSPYEIQVVFTDSDRKDWFGARVDLHATVILRSKDRTSTSTTSMPTHGSYIFAKRTVHLDPPESDRLGLELVFDTGSNDSVDCYVVRESTGERCAQFVLFRE